MIFKTYGVILALAVLLGSWVSSLEAKRRGRDSTLVWDALLWVLGGGLVGARLYHILSLWEFYRQHPLAVLFLWNGGLGIYGALGGGLFGLLVFLKLGRTRLRQGFGEVFALLDIAAPGLAVGQAVGRFANYFNQEIYGWPTNLPWGIYIEAKNRFPGLESYSFFHPLFLYEALWNLLNFVLILLLSIRFTHRLLPGEVFLFYLSFYAGGRFFLESGRISSWEIGGVPVAQVLSLLIIFASITITVVRRARRVELKLGV